MFLFVPMPVAMVVAVIVMPSFAFLSLSAGGVVAAGGCGGVVVDAVVAVAGL